MRSPILLLCLFFLFYDCNKSEPSDMELTQIQTQSIFYKGMDLSFQPELETYEVSYKDGSGNTIQLLDHVADNGANLIRLRLWHTPQNGQNGLAQVKAYAQRIKSRNMELLLDFHYSDSWADPGQQTPPLAWQTLNPEQLKLAIYNYTKTVVQELKNQNTLPKIIQIGNETDSGFLWNHGRVWDAYADNWPSYTALVTEAISAIREVDTAGTVKIMLHHSNVENAVYFFNELQSFNLDFDIIGLSYYPQFQIKNPNVIQSKLNELATIFDKEILMVEVAYPFTFGYNDSSSNYIVDSSQILSEFPATPQGQKAYVEWLVSVIKAIPNEKGIGFCYWAPDWVAFEGNQATSTHGSAWENQCMFDFDHKALPVFGVFKNP